MRFLYIYVDSAFTVIFKAFLSRLKKILKVVYTFKKLKSMDDFIYTEILHITALRDE